MALLDQRKHFAVPIVRLDQEDYLEGWMGSRRLLHELATWNPSTAAYEYDASPAAPPADDPLLCIVVVLGLVRLDNNNSTWIVLAIYRSYFHKFLQVCARLCASLCKAAQVLTSLCKGVPSCTSLGRLMHNFVEGCGRLHNDVQVCTCKHVQGCASLYQYAQVCARLCEAVQGCARI